MSGLEEWRAISCGICNNPYTTESDNEEQQPQTICNNNHMFCKRCCPTLKECPICKAVKKVPTQNMDKETIQRVIEKREKIMVGVARIPIEELEFLNKHAVAYGSFADVYHCKWRNTVVALKQLRRDPKTHKMEDIKLEAALCFQMRHDNIVTFYGLTKLENNFFGLVLEWADQGTLRQNMKDLKTDQKIKISLCICEGLSYMHSNRIAHRDLKPENVLLFGDKSKAKISDFGTSKNIQTFNANSGMVGTPIYWAPELTGVAKQVKQINFVHKIR
jgi:tRNA A-37 threonylcarbamoyl transferase component Bud32